MTARVSLDFKNGVYSIGGVEKTVAECVITGSSYGFSYGDIIPGVGLRVIADAATADPLETITSFPRLSPAARLAVLADGVNAGFTAVTTAITYASISDQAYVDVVIGDNSPITQGWGFQQNWRVIDSNLSCLYDFSAAPFDNLIEVPMTAMGRRKGAFLLSSTILAGSIDGAAVVSVAPSQGTTGENIEVGVEAHYDATGGFAIAILEKVEFFAAVDDEELPTLSEPEDGFGDGLLDYSVRLRSWGYVLDGHAYAVFRLGPTETLVYDLTTNQWASWASPGRDNWRVHCGQNWIGMSTDTLANGFGSDVVVGDDASNALYILDPTSGRDDRSTTGSDLFDRTAMGLITIDGREVLNCGAVTLSLSVGNPSQTGADITLYTSDDGGQSWTDHGSNVIVAGEYSAVVEWRALGLGRAPGRLFKFVDNGAATRISAADLR